MDKGDLVMPLNEDELWDAPGVIVRGPYGHVEKVRSRWDGKALELSETKVVDVLLGSRVYKKIPIENLKVLK